MANLEPLIPDRRLLDALAEQLKEPLVYIAREAELAAITSDVSALKRVQFSATTGLQLIDSFLLSTELSDQQSFELEPISISATLYDIAEELLPLARQQDCELRVTLAGRYGPIMAHGPSLRAAFRLLGQSFLSGQATAVELGAHRSIKGIVAGVFSNQPGLSTDVYQRGRALFGTARSPMPGMRASAGAGVFVAESLLGSSAARLKAAKHNKQQGLAVTLRPSLQLQLI